MYRLLFAVLAAGCALGLTAAAAAARFDHATPGPGAVVARDPLRIDLYTVRPTSPLATDTQIVVLDANRHEVDNSDSTVDPADHRHVWVTLQPQLDFGRYIVTFKTRGERDFDHDGGDYAFYVGTPPTPAEKAADAFLSLTTLGGEDVLTGYRRGLVEGLLTVAIGGPIAIYLMHRHYRRRKSLPAADGTPDLDV